MPELPWEIEVHVITTLLTADWLASSGRPAGGDATQLFFSQVAYLVHDDVEAFVFNTFFVSPVVWSELSCDEDFLSLLQKIPRDGLLVVIELLLEDDAAEEDGLLV